MAMVAWLVSSARITSTSFMMCAGLKKCSPKKRSGRDVLPARALILRLEVLLARMVAGGSRSSSSAKICRFNPRISGAASMMIPAGAIPASEVVRCSATLARAATAAAVLPRATPLSIEPQIAARAAAKIDSSIS